MPVLEIKRVEKSSVLGIWDVRESIKELEEMVPEIASSEKYLSFNHDLRRTEWLASRVLMKEMKLDWNLEYSIHGKPFYSNGPKISISHSKNYIAIVTDLENEVGIDVQEVLPKVARIKHKYCNDFELDWARTVEDFTLIWSAKEAMFKVKERNVIFSEDIQVGPPSGQSVQVLFRGKQEYLGSLLDLKGYKGVFIVE